MNWLKANQLSRLLDWPDFSKARFVAAVGLGVDSLFLLWGLIGELNHQTRPHLDQQYAVALLIMYASYVVVWLVSNAVGYWIRERRRAHKAYVVFIIVFFAVSKVSGAWFTGLFNFISGALLVSAPLFGVILFESRAVIVVSISVIIVYTILVMLTVAGYLSYAPFFSSLPVSDSGLWVPQVLAEYVIGIGFFGFLFYLSCALIARWRDREREVQRLSVTDDLTGIDNRRAIIHFLDEALKRQKRTGSELSVVLVDLDHFKSINDSHGHEAGDLVLREAAASLHNSLRETDRVGRFGGEEFLVVLPDTDESGAQAIVRRCSDHLRSAAISRNGATVRVTGSFGIATARAGDAPESPETLLNRADEALYRAKAEGRDRAVSWRPDASSDGH